MSKSENIRVVKYTSDKKEAWNAYVKASKNGTFLFDRDFMEYHADRFVDFSLMVYENEKIVALFPANRNEEVVCSHQGLSYGGLILSAKEKYKSCVFIFRALLCFLEQQGVKTVEIKEIPSIYALFPSDEILHLLFLCKAELYRRDGLSVIEMKNDLMFGKSRKSEVKKGIKNKLNVKEVGAFDTFWNEILIPNLRKKHNAKPVHSLEEITLLKERFPKNIRQFNVYKDEVIVAGTTIFESKRVAHSQYISKNSENNDLGSLDFLHDYMLKNVFQEKDYFDFGISNEAQGTKVNSGLQFWKESFGARMVTQDFYRVKTSNYKLLNEVLL